MTARTADTVLPARAAPRAVPLTWVTQVELRKMFDTRSGFWLTASIVVTGVIWLVVPLAVGLRFVTRVEVK